MPLRLVGDGDGVSKRGGGAIFLRFRLCSWSETHRHQSRQGARTRPRPARGEAGRRIDSLSTEIYGKYLVRVTIHVSTRV